MPRHSHPPAHHRRVWRLRPGRQWPIACTPRCMAVQVANRAPSQARFSVYPKNAFPHEIKKGVPVFDRASSDRFWHRLVAETSSLSSDWDCAGQAQAGIVACIPSNVLSCCIFTPLTVVVILVLCNWGYYCHHHSYAQYTVQGAEAAGSC